jgi:hypothetical protein
MIARKPCKARHLHDPAGAVVVFGVHFVPAIGMRGQPFQVLAKPVLGCSIK